MIFRFSDHPTPNTPDHWVPIPGCIRARAAPSPSGGVSVANQRKEPEPLVILTEAARPNGSKTEWKDPENLSANHAASGSSSQMLSAPRYETWPPRSSAGLSPRRGRLVVARRFNGGKRKRNAFFLAPQARGPRRARPWLDGVEISAQRCEAPAFRN